MNGKIFMVNDSEKLTVYLMEWTEEILGEKAGD